jgi:hypothetical protein
MKSFKKYIDAENYAKEVSAKNLKPISIVHLLNCKDFTVMDTKDEWFCHIQHVMLISNFKTLFEVHSVSPKSGKHIEGFATKELAQNRRTELEKGNYRKNIYQLDLTLEQYSENWVKPFMRSEEASNEYRKTLMEV